MGNSVDEREATVNEEPVRAQMLGPEAPRSSAAAVEASTERRLVHPGTIFLGEAVVDSAHEHPFPLPFNLDAHARRARVAFTVADEQFRLSLPEVVLASAYDGVAATSEPPPRVTIMFKPKHAGRSISFVQLNAVWNDGHSEQLEVQVISSARNKEDAPGSSTAVPKTTAASPAADDRAPTLAIFDEYAKNLDGKIAQVSGSRSRGVQDIYDEAGKFLAPPPPKSTWVMLAELAVTIGTAGAAAIVGKFVSEQFSGLVAKEAAHAEAAVAKEAAHVASTAVHTGEVAAGHVATHAVEAAGRQAGHGAAASVEHAAESSHGHLKAEGVAAGIEDAIKEIKVKIPEPAEQGNESAPQETISKNTMIAFFDAQQEALSATITDQTRSLNRFVGTLRGGAEHDPGPAVAAILALEAGLEGGRLEMKKTQMSASATQWAAYVAQGTYGHEEARNKNNEPVSVTRTEELRKQETVYGDIEMASRIKGGVLEIYVGVGPGGGIRMGGARLDGVSRLIGDRFLRMNLRDAAIPVRIRTGVEDVITIDEAGRIRTGGPRQYEPDQAEEGTGGEAQNLQAAERIVEIVFSKTLSQWGVSHIASNDSAK